MIVELTLALAGTYAYNYLNTINERKLKYKFTSVMNAIGIQNKKEQTFKIYKTIPTSYGYMCYINIPDGLSVEHLNSKLNILEDNLNGIIDIEKEKFKSNIVMRIVDRDLNKFMFKPVKCYSNQLLLGKDYKGQDYLLDLNNHPMVLIAGATGYGKSMLLACILANLIYNTPNDIELYLTQLIKGEISSFEDCNPVKMIAYNEKELEVAIDRVRKKIDERSKLFISHGIRNINQWNKHFPRQRMKRVILVCEEMSELMELDVWSNLWKVVKAGRSVGVHLIGALQRTTATNLDTDVKSQMTRITFHQNSIIDSQNVINSNNAMKLKRGECIICGNNGEENIKVPFIDDDFVILHKYINEIRIPSADKSKEYKSKPKKDIEILNIDKENNQILTLESHKIVDVEDKDIKQSDNKGNPPQRKFKTGTISMEEYKCSQKEIRKF
jgi:energy-coupling factor transporter ATP-binding protein EcfA2